MPASRTRPASRWRSRSRCRERVYLFVITNPAIIRPDYQSNDLRRLRKQLCQRHLVPGDRNGHAVAGRPRGHVRRLPRRRWKPARRSRYVDDDQRRHGDDQRQLMVRRRLDVDRRPTSARAATTSTWAAITASNALAAGQSYTGSATVTIPYTVHPGTYYIIVRADRPSQVPGEQRSDRPSSACTSRATRTTTRPRPRFR